MADEVIDTVKPVVRPAPAKAVAKPSPAKTSGFEVPKELLDDIARSDKMVRDNSIKVLLIIGPNTPTERQIPLPSVARAIKAKFTA